LILPVAEAFEHLPVALLVNFGDNGDSGAEGTAHAG
jgi:hypothetical protein